MIAMQEYIVSRIMLDIRFAEQDPEFASDAPMLRYVAAINPDASRTEFVEAAVACGYRANSAGNRFRESRQFDANN